MPGPQLVSADPKDELARGRLAYAETRVARLELRLGRRAEALKHVTAAIAHHEAVIARTNSASIRRELGGSLVTLAQVVADRPSESCAAYKKARDIFAAAGNAQLRGLRRARAKGHGWLPEVTRLASLGSRYAVRGPLGRV